MLSILIPTRDYDCNKLVQALHRQCSNLQQPCEIIVGEDGSSAKGVALNEPLRTLPHCRIVTLSENVGRAKIRNRLAREAKYKFLLFIDSDAIVEDEKFLSRYIDALAHNNVVCGGLYHPDIQPDGNCSLRYKYEKKADKRRNASIRNKNPYNNFSTFNFAIERKLFLSILFNENITRYGYEDTLFGYSLRRMGTDIKHIDNPLLHTGLESNHKYLNKIDESIDTLLAIRHEIDETPLLAYANKLERMHLAGIVATMWKISKGTLRNNLLGRHPSLLLLNIYKLGRYCYLLNQEKQHERHTKHT